MSDEFAEVLNSALTRANYVNRSEFIRDAIVEKLERSGISVPPEIVDAPVRAGRVGPRKKRKANTDHPGSMRGPLKRGPGIHEPFADSVGERMLAEDRPSSSRPVVLPDMGHTDKADIHRTLRKAKAASEF